ncbi:MAG: GNAT family N-acetyltransferase [bacterium]|nr:GNAT family N-acetyltransferase [bacterium]
MQAPATVRQEQTHPECVLRQAETADAEAVYEIRNDPTARASSRTQETILLEDHLRWFEKHYFSGSGHLCYVLTLEQRVIGYCRFDRRSTGGFNLSIAIAPSCRGRGMGRFLLKESLARITTQEEIYAEVFTFNQASRALFEKCAFVLDQESDGVLFFRRPAISL